MPTALGEHFFSVILGRAEQDPRIHFALYFEWVIILNRLNHLTRQKKNDTIFYY